MEKHSVVVAFESDGWDGVLREVTALPLADGLRGLNNLIIHFRWKMKDLEGVVRATEMAERFAGDTNDQDALGSMKAVAFNRAAFFWRGFGDSDVEISAEAEAEAVRYAEMNLELARRLGKKGVPLGRAEWLIGAFDWATGHPDSAADRFDVAAELIAEGDDPLEIKMCRAYAMAARGEDPEGILRELDVAENGNFYAGQVRSAMKIYGPG